MCTFFVYVQLTRSLMSLVLCVLKTDFVLATFMPNQLNGKFGNFSYIVTCGSLLRFPGVVCHIFKYPLDMDDWRPDCLDRCLGFSKGSPRTTAATGYYMLRIIYAVIVVHSGIIFASVITYAALEVTNCTSSNNDDGGACGADDDTGDDSEHCVRLWGLMKPDSLLTVIGTTAAVVLAFSAAVTGTAMDITPYRRQIGLIGNILCIAGMVLCLPLLKPTNATLAIASVGLILVLIFKDYLNLQIDSYGPELSKNATEIGTAVTAGFTWALVAEVLMVILWTVVGMGMSNDTYGFVVTLGSIGMMAISSYLSYRRLPDVPSSYALPAGKNIVQFTFARLRALIIETYQSYPDLGLLLLSAMIFDPALTAVFAAAVLILISKYHFSAANVTLLLGLAIISAIPAVPLSCWLASTPSLNSCFRDADKELAPVHSVEGDVDSNQQNAEDRAPVVESRFHAHRVKIILIWGLVLTIINTILVVVILKACQFALACVFSFTWGFLLSFCWNCLSMLRIALVPGGRESEYAGLYLALYSSMIWLPLFVFSVANEIWNINGAMYVLTIFFGIGAVLLWYVDIDRALAVRLESLGMRRWVQGGASCVSIDGASAGGASVDGASAEGGSTKNVMNSV